MLGVPERYRGATLLPHSDPLHRWSETETLATSIPAPVSVQFAVKEKFPIGNSAHDAIETPEITGGVVSGTKSPIQEKYGTALPERVVKAPQTTRFP